MRRAVPAIITTVAGLGLLSAFHTTTGQAVATSAATEGSARPTGARTPPAGAPPNGSASPSTMPGSRQTVDGTDERNRYGDVQVRVTLQGSQIVDVQALVLPNDRERSAQISDYAEPRLRQEVLRAQSANVNIISGATYTSLGYEQSLQSALDRAGVH